MAKIRIVKSSQDKLTQVKTVNANLRHVGLRLTKPTLYHYLNKLKRCILFTYFNNSYLGKIMNQILPRSPGPGVK